MQRVSVFEFTNRFPKRKPSRKITDVNTDHVSLAEDARVMGILNNGLTVKSGVFASVTGIVNGPLTIENGAVAYITGIIEGDVRVDGAACITGILNGNLRAADYATLAFGSGVLTASKTQ